MATPRFISVEEYLERQAPAARAVLQRLRQIIAQTCPEATEKLRWNLPFYDYLGMMAYLNVRKGGVVELAFNEGAQMEPHPTLQLLDRNSICSVLVPDLASLDEDQIRYFLCEAMAINEDIKAGRRSRVIGPKAAAR